MDTITRVPEDSSYVELSSAIGPQDRLCVTLESGVKMYFELVVRGTQQERLMVLDVSVPGVELQLIAAHVDYRRQRPSTKIEAFKVLFYVWKDGERHTRHQPRIDQEFCLWIGTFSDQAINTKGYTLPGGPIRSVKWVKIPV